MDDEIYRPEILLVEDDEIMRVTVSDHLRKKGWTVTVAEDGMLGMEQMKKKDFDIVICDIRLPKKNGMELLREAKETSSQAEFIMMTAYGTIGDAVEAMRLGARDYITKPFHADELVIRVKKIIEHNTLLAKYELLKENAEERYAYQNIIGRSKKMQAIFSVIEKVSKIDTNVIILGESGTGKGLVANVIHTMSSRRDRPFVKVNCAALPEALLESELFGHEKGAFTGAIRKKFGKFELADRGTIFFDEIGDIPPFVQAKLLRVIQEHEFERVGGEETIKVDVRLVSATKEDLEDLVANGKFREDLYFRLKVISIYLPPLRERKEDIPFLAEEFLKRFNKKLKKNLTLSNEAAKCLLSYDYPGNVRELENIIERTAAMTDGDVIRAKDIFHSFDKNIRIYSDKEEENLTLKELLTRIEREHLIKVLEETDGNKVEAARILEKKKKNLWEKLKVYHL
ncbi:MAG: sigma-54-dependent Fis family transcriptional regulator, partial [Nitrospirae bacterium]|nr:sigma-54-dependent Fis family transcriptional regulator [Nitrospirota bacterium]